MDWIGHIYVLSSGIANSQNSNFPILWYNTLLKTWAIIIEQTKDVLFSYLLDNVK